MAASSSESDSYLEQWLDGPLSTKFYTRLYTPPTTNPPRAVMIFIHGYLEHVGRYTPIHTQWAQDGIAVFTYDMRGFGKTALGEKRSKDSAYGKTGGRRERMSDVEWAVKYAHERFPSLPLFLMGHSMGGGLALSFATRTYSPPDAATVALLSGVISSSPLVGVAARQPSPFMYKVLSIAAKYTPNLPLSTPVQDQDLSHDASVGSDSLKDPLVQGTGCAEGLYDMISRGTVLLSEGYKSWPISLPVLILHGTSDNVNSFAPTKDFCEKLEANDKEFIVYEGMMHDLMTEPDLKDKYFPDCRNWLLKHIPASSE